MNYQIKTLLDDWPHFAGQAAMQQLVQRPLSPTHKLLRLAKIRIMTDDLLWAIEQCKSYGNPPKT